ncbi:hypothetical protein B0H14DRAFT_2693542, partial [Mycena olivaceomarginata]
DTMSRLIQDKVVKLTVGPTERLEIPPAEDESQDRDVLTESDVDLDPITPSLPSSASKLPEETLLLIFRHTVPPAWTIRYSNALPPFPRTSWSNADLGTKLTIMRVCKTWHRVGLEFLYESVALHSIGQLPAFVNALEARMGDGGGTGGVGAFVRRLEIGYWVPRPYDALHETELAGVLALCPRLTHFAYNPQVLDSWRPALPSFDPIPGSAALTLTHLEICDMMPYFLVIDTLVHLAPTLESLSLLLPGNADYEPEMQAPPAPVTFPRLTHLRLGLDRNSTPPGAHWALPTLTHLLLRPRTDALRPMDFDYHATARAFLAAHGRTLRVLSVRPNVRPHAALGDMLRLCPALWHLCVGEAELRAGLSLSLKAEGGGVLHAGLRSVDVFGAEAPWGSGLDPGTVNLKHVFPALRECRYIRVDSRVLRFFPDAPRAMLNKGEEESDFFLSNEGIHKINSVFLVNDEETDALPHSSCLAYLLSDACAGDDEDEDDSDYTFDEADDDGGSVGSEDSSDESDSVDDAESDSGHEEWKETDREEALAAFRRTLIE